MHTLGSIDDTSKRTIVQPHDRIDELAGEAAGQSAWLQGHLDRAVDAVPGARLVGVRVKDLEGIVRKVEEGQPAHTVSDYLGGRIAIDDLATADSIIARLGRVVKDDAFFANSKYDRVR
jgi:hypothetical protein